MIAERKTRMEQEGSEERIEKEISSGATSWERRWKDRSAGHPRELLVELYILEKHTLTYLLPTVFEGLAHPYKQNIITDNTTSRISQQHPEIQVAFAKEAEKQQ